MKETIKCPSCGDSFELSEAISRDIENSIRKKHEIEIEETRKTLEQEFKVREHEYEKNAKEERTLIIEKATKDAHKTVTFELSDLKEQLKEKTEGLEDSRKQEIELRKKQRELLEKEKNMELQLTRQLDEERQKVLEKAAAEFDDRQRLKDAEKDKQLNDMKKQIDELKRKSELGSQQNQGEVLELELENILKASFPHDLIEPVPKGIRGADVLQKVHSSTGQYCGTIVWETKRTKAWSDSWIAKLKEDQRRIKGEIAVILTTTMPRDISNFGNVNGVWITNHNSMIGLATAIRMNLVEITNTKLAAVGKKEKMEVVYNYLSGAEFKQKVEAIVEVFKDMKDGLENEKKAFAKIWAKREKQIELVNTNTASMYGDIHGIIGASLPQIKLLELESGEEDDEIVLDS
jgi:hypothetical protein